MEQVLGQIKQKFPNAGIVEPSPVKGYPTVKLSSKEDLLPFMTYLKEELGFDYLDMVTAVDWKGPVEPRGYITDPNPNPFLPEGAVPQVTPEPATPGFPYREAIEIVYAVTNLKERLKLFVRVEVARTQARVASVISLWKAADWQERETFDLMEVVFEGHPNLKKILTPEFIQGHPLRKDYVHVKDKYD